MMQEHRSDKAMILGNAHAGGGRSGRREWWERIVLDYVAGCAHEYAEHRRFGVASEPMTVEEAHRWEIGTLATVLEELRREHERQALEGGV